MRAVTRSSLQIRNVENFVPAKPLKINVPGRHFPRFRLTAHSANANCPPATQADSQGVPQPNRPRWPQCDNTPQISQQGASPGSVTLCDFRIQSDNVSKYSF
jgi:hypothetical protein